MSGSASCPVHPMPPRPEATPKVTVFIPVHNRARYVCVAVNSILAQDFEDFELLVVDDGSTDDTVATLERFDDPRLRIATNGENRGIPYTRNHGLELARGEYIALLDSDDHAYPNRLGRQVAFLDRNPDIVQVGSWCSFMDSEGAMLPKVRRQPLAPDDLHAHLLFHCPLINRTIMARTAVLQAYRYDLDYPRCQDYDMHARLSAEHRMANLPELLVCGREHPGRWTGNSADLGRDRKIAVARRLLERIGIEADETELRRHHALTRKDEKRDDLEGHLDWTESWLWRIKQANRRQPHFPKAALDRAIGAIWALNCWQARRVLGRRQALTKVVGSRLSRGLPGNFSARFLWATRQRAPIAEADDRPPTAA
ncbi:glycosyltransferase family 2 protein [Wenzhouxiangella sp. XN79A]|uniref:glycosyltransferase family 2 protein n=1 Tax=Wenzhouxiangella sp. XN79A TaxID=2724193 RepID=UPI0019822B19|nr:glycosyltransferase family 2 protein [Wenzhouxiangella sp. XN79A]